MPPSCEAGGCALGPMALAARTGATRLGVMLIASVVLGCGTDATLPTPAPDAAHLYWSLTLDQHAVTLSTTSPFDTERVTATPRDATGAPLTGVGAATYKSLDLARVQVTPDGLLHGIDAGDGVAVVATLTAGDVTHTDTVMVNVRDVADPPMLTTFSIHPVPPDSAVWPMTALGTEWLTPIYGAGPKALPLRALDANGQSISDLPVDFRSSDSTIASVERQTGVFTAHRPGRVTFFASTTWYGVATEDSVSYQITLPLVQSIALVQGYGGTRFSPSGAKIVVGGYVSFIAPWPSADVVFDAPGNIAEDSIFCQCGAGNIGPFGGDTLNFLNDIRIRRFPVAGTYIFRDKLSGATDSIIVAQAADQRESAAERDGWTRPVALPMAVARPLNPWSPRTTRGERSRASASPAGSGARVRDALRR